MTILDAIDKLHELMDFEFTDVADRDEYIEACKMAIAALCDKLSYSDSGKNLAKREFITKEDALMALTGCFELGVTLNKYSASCEKHINAIQPITEQDIVKPYLEKLKIRLADIAKEVDSNIVVGLVMAINEINILSEYELEVYTKDEIRNAIDEVEDYICNTETDTVKAQGMAQALDILEQSLMKGKADGTC